MKSKDFAIFAADFAAVLDDNGATEGAVAWRLMASMFTVKPNAKVAEICGLIRHDVSPRPGGLRVESIVRSVPGLLKLLGPKPQKVTAEALRTVETVLLPYTSSGLEPLVEQVSAMLTAPMKKSSPAGGRAALNVVVVERHVESLEQSFRDEAAFKLAYSALTNDEAVKTKELKAIAKSFAGGTAKTKEQALKFIMGHHNALMVSRAKDAATAGRTAA